MKFILNISVVCLLWLAYSCGVPRYIKKTYIGCYNGALTGIDTLLDLSGCFNASVPYSDHDEFERFCAVNFYNDGIVIRFCAAVKSIDLLMNKQRKYHNIRGVFLDLDNYKYYYEGRNIDWGLYQLKGDTIIAQFIEHPYPPALYYSHLIMYKIIDKYTIQEIFNKRIQSPKEPESIYRETPFLNKYYNFIPIEKLPSSDCWLKGEKWFWCNEKDWKEYKKRINK
jgi:hypothetical protein